MYDDENSGDIYETKSASKLISNSDHGLSNRKETEEQEKKGGSSRSNQYTTRENSGFRSKYADEIHVSESENNNNDNKHSRDYENSNDRSPSSNKPFSSRKRQENRQQERKSQINQDDNDNNNDSSKDKNNGYDDDLFGDKFVTSSTNKRSREESLSPVRDKAQDRNHEKENIREKNDVGNNANISNSGNDRGNERSSNRSNDRDSNRSRERSNDMVKHRASQRDDEKNNDTRFKKENPGRDKSNDSHSSQRYHNHGNHNNEEDFDDEREVNTSTNKRKNSSSSVSGTATIIPKGPSSWRNARPSKPSSEYREKDRHRDDDSNRRRDEDRHRGEDRYRDDDRHREDFSHNERSSWKSWNKELGHEKGKIESRSKKPFNSSFSSNSVTKSKNNRFDTLPLPFVESSYLSYNSASIFKRTCQVGEGTYGKVYKAVNIRTNNMVALKRLRLEAERDGVPITAVREIKLLQSLQHKNIVQLQEMMVERSQFYMVFEYADHDLAGLLAIPNLKLSLGNIKYMFRQAMEGLAFVHHRGVLHRDIKGSNILVTSSGQVKLADFGLARSINIYVRPQDAMYTNRVITLWYRPPELLLGETHYDCSVDIWGMGCLLMEFFTRKAIFQGTEEVSQLLNIYKTMGTPAQNGWDEAQSLPWHSMLSPSRLVPSRFAELYKDKIPELVFNLVEQMLQMNPRKRITARQVLQDDFFQKGPEEEVPLQIKDLKGEWHDFEAKQRKKKAKEASRKKEKQQQMEKQQQHNQMERDHGQAQEQQTNERSESAGVSEN